jgi:hypothetical protein
MDRFSFLGVIALGVKILNRRDTTASIGDRSHCLPGASRFLPILIEPQSNK